MDALSGGTQMTITKEDFFLRRGNDKDNSVLVVEKSKLDKTLKALLYNNLVIGEREIKKAFPYLAEVKS